MKIEELIARLQEYREQGVKEVGIQYRDGGGPYYGWDDEPYFYKQDDTLILL